MKFSEKIVRDAFERSALKLAVLVLSVTTLSFSVMLVMDLSKEALVVDRGCESQIAKIGSQSQSRDQVHNFLVKAVEARFNTLASADPTAFLVQDLLISRAKEQDGLKGPWDRSAADCSRNETHRGQNFSRSRPINCGWSSSFCHSH